LPIFDAETCIISGLLLKLLKLFKDQYMDVFEAISKRHSYRGTFRPTPVPAEHLRQIVEAGLLAPSGCNAQSTTFVIVNEPDLVKLISQLSTGRAMLSAQAYIACVVNEVPVAAIAGMSFEVEDCSAAVENMLLAITALGYATVWIDGWLRGQSRAEKIAEILGLPAGKRIRVILPIGIPAEPLAPPVKKPFEERAWFNTYGSQATGPARK
jgi:nitroreductase